MKKWPDLSRRELIKQFGFAAFLAQPVFRAFAQQVNSAPLRYLSFFKANGFVANEFWPTAQFRFGQNLLSAPLDQIRTDIRLVRNISLGRRNGNAHGVGPHVLFTGVNAGDPPPGMDTSLPTVFPFTTGVSIDQMIANRFQQNPQTQTIIPALHFGLGMIGPVNGQDWTRINRISFRGGGVPNDPEIQPNLMFDRIMQAISRVCRSQSNTPVNQQAKDEEIRQLRLEKSLLDFNLEEIQNFKRRYRLDGAQAAKLDATAEQFRELERSLQQEVELIERSVASAPSSDQPLCPQGLSRPPGGIQVMWRNPVTQATFDQMIGLVKLAFEFDVTRVITFQLGGGQNPAVYPALGINTPHHALTHGSNANLQDLFRVDRYILERFTQLVQSIKEIQDPNGRDGLYNSLVFLGTEVSDGPTHQRTNMPFVLAGHAGGRLRQAGRVVNLAQQHNHQDLLSTVVRLYGIEQMVGDTNFRRAIISDLI